MNPYVLLRISRDASVSEIEDAYDALFDEYEPRAQEGHADAIDALNALNDARDTLVDPNRRAKVDARLARAEQPAPAPKPKAAPPRETPRPPSPPLVERPPRPPRPGGRPGAGPATIKTRRRASYALPEVKPRRSWLPLLPFLVAIAVLGFAIAVGVTYLLTRDDGVPDDLPAGATVATVNGVPIYQRELDEREAIDKNNALNDPLFSSFFDPNTITGTRALDTLKYDSLDKLINMEVIKQQAQKEGIWPTPEQQEELVRQTAATDQLPGEGFKQMLARIGVSEAKYRRTVIENVVYTVMANQHLPAEGTPELRTEGFIKWICDTRAGYDVKILLTFIVTNNPPCTSGLPSDVPLPGIDQTTPPEAEPTAVTPAEPASPPPGPNPTSAP
jgi:hypothetical protein